MTTGRADLGSAASWLRDGLLMGALSPLAAGAGFCMLGLLLFGSPIPSSVLTLWFRMTLAGTLFGAVAALPLRWVARALWRMPLAAFALGPVVCGAALSISILLYSAREGQLGSLDLRALGLAVVFGALAIGPPWIAYLAVRSRGRSGLGAIAIAPLWSAGWTAALLGIIKVVDVLM